MLSQAHQLIDYDRDPEQPGRPLLLLLAGAALACLALFLLFIIAFRTWVTHEVDPSMAYWGVSLLFCFYLLGIYIFSYAFELYDVGKALRLTLIIAVFSVMAVVVIVGALAVLTKAHDAVKGVGGGGGSKTADKAASFLPVISSYLGGEDGNYERRREREVDAPPATDRPFTIGCQGCGQRFTPAPPDAKCPFCGRAALAASGGR